MSDNIFLLIGHDCPLGYPSPVVPVGYLNNTLVAVYASDRVSEAPIGEDSIFIRHTKKLTKEIGKFDHNNHRLFGFSNYKVEKYPIDYEDKYFKTLLLNQNFAKTNPFIRLSLAKRIGETQTLFQEIFLCALHLRATSPSFLNTWYENQYQQIYQTYPNSVFLSFPENWEVIEEILIPEQIDFIKSFNPEFKPRYHRSEKVNTIPLSSTKMENNFKESVVDNLEKGFEMAMLSLGDENEAYNILKKASEQFLVTQSKNLEKIRSQEIAREKQYYKKSKNTFRKTSAKRTYHPVGANLFQYLVKENLAVEERKQEILGQSLSQDAILFRFFHKLFENENLSKGAFNVAAGLFGILLDLNPTMMKEISAHFHGIDSNYDINHRDFRESSFFLNATSKMMHDLLSRFESTGFFEIVPIDQQPPHNEFKKQIKKDLTEWIKFKPADEDTIKTVEKILELLAPWGETPLSPKDIPTYNLRYNRIPELVSEKSQDETALEMKRVSTIMNLRFVEALLANESLRTKNMIKNLYLPVINNEYSFNVKNQVKPLDKEFVLEVVMKALSKQIK